MSNQKFESQFNFRCPFCNFSDLITIGVPEFNFNVERMSELYSEDNVEFICPSCEADFYGDIVCTSSSCEISISDPVEFTMVGDPPMFGSDPAAAYDPPEHPYELFEETVERCLQVSELEFRPLNDPQFLKRMAFTTIITALETYLSDELLSKLKSDNAALSNLLSKDSHFAGLKVSLSQIIGRPDFVYNYVRPMIQEISFHNLPRADVIYKSALGVTLQIDNGVWARLNSDIKVRHDCVHRNGNNADGERRNDLTL